MGGARGIGLSNVESGRKPLRGGPDHVGLLIVIVGPLCRYSKLSTAERDGGLAWRHQVSRPDRPEIKYG
jgi:hypothetical protein